MINNIARKILFYFSQLASLTEKLQAKDEEAGVAPPPAQKPETLPGEVADVVGVQFSVKVEDRLSTGSGGSAVVDEEGLQLVDSGDSYFHSIQYLPAAEGMQSEEDDGSDDGQNYFSYVFAAAEQHQQEGETMGWCVWSN